MSEKDNVFRAFVRANELERVTEFTGLGREDPMYVKDDTSARRSEIERTIGFAGFVDGYMRRGERFKGPRGSLDAARTEGFSVSHGLAEELLETYVEGHPEREEQLRRVRESMGGSRGAYHEQYRKGLAASRL